MFRFTSELDEHAAFSGAGGPNGHQDPCSGHVVQFYEEGVFPYSSIADFIWTGIQAGESAIVITLPEHIARLRAERPASKLRLIALTGYGQDSDREQSRKAGFDFHLVKPVDFDTLQRAIQAPAE